MRQDTAYSLLLIIGFISTLLIASSHGKDSRVFSTNIVTIGEGVPDIFVFEEQKDVFRLWKSRGLYGRVVLHFDNAMDIKPLKDIKMDIVRGFFHVPGLLASLESELDSENFMFFSIINGIARSVIGIVPENRFLMMDGYLKSSRYLAYGSSYRGAVESVPKVVTTIKGLPPLKEPVLFNFDANFFSSPDIVPEDLFGMLKRLKIKTDLLTFSLSKTHPDVTSDGIKKMEKFIRLLRTHED